MGNRSISGLFRLSHGSLVGHEPSARQMEGKSSTVIMQPNLGEILSVSPRVLLHVLRSETTYVSSLGPHGAGILKVTVAPPTFITGDNHIKQLHPGLACLDQALALGPPEAFLFPHQAPSCWRGKIQRDQQDISCHVMCSQKCPMISSDTRC